MKCNGGNRLQAFSKACQDKKSCDASQEDLKEEVSLFCFPLRQLMNTLDIFQSDAALIASADARTACKNHQPKYRRTGVKNFRCISLH